MIKSREYAHKLIDQIPDREYAELIDFLKFLNNKSFLFFYGFIR